MTVAHTGSQMPAAQREAIKDGLKRVRVLVSDLLLLYCCLGRGPFTPETFTVAMYEVFQSQVEEEPLSQLSQAFNKIWHLGNGKLEDFREATQFRGCVDIGPLFDAYRTFARESPDFLSKNKASGKPWRRRSTPSPERGDAGQSSAEAWRHAPGAAASAAQGADIHARRQSRSLLPSFELEVVCVGIHPAVANLHAWRVQSQLLACGGGPSLIPGLSTVISIEWVTCCPFLIRKLLRMPQRLVATSYHEFILSENRLPAPATLGLRN